MEVLIGGRWMLPVFLIATAVGAALVGIAGRASGWVGALLVVLGLLVGLVGLGSLVFFLWGRWFGLPWHFLREPGPRSPSPVGAPRRPRPA